MSSNKVKEKSLRSAFALRAKMNHKYKVEKGVITGVWLVDKDKNRSCSPNTWYAGKPAWLPIVMAEKPVPCPKNSFEFTVTADMRINFPDLAAVASITVRLHADGKYISHTSNPLRFE